MVISEMPCGTSFVVRGVTVGREIGKRLADMGFTAGAEGSVVRRSFWRGPIQVRIRGYDILIREREAAAIVVDPIGPIFQRRRRFAHGWR